MEKKPIVRPFVHMQKGIRHVPKPVKKPIPDVRTTPKPVHRTTLRAKPNATPAHRTTLRATPAHRTTLRATPNPTPKPMHRTGPTPRPRKTMKRIPSPNPWANLNMKSANMLYDPANPSPKVNVDSRILFQKMTELQDMLKVLKQSRKRNVSMNASAKAYLNRASYDDPLLDGSLKLTGIKGTPLM